MPIGFPDVLHPKGNEPTEARLALGKKLFFDPIMSEDRSTSCASCHAPDLAFSDSVAKSIGIRGMLGTQNAPSLMNIAYHPYFTRAGGVPTLEMQILVPIQEHNELGSNIIDIADRMCEDSTYVEMSFDAYDQEPNAFVITRAISCFERSLISGNSRYDQYFHQGDSTALSTLELAGMDLFFGDKAKCSSCHSGFNFTDYSFQNNGLYMNYADSGRYRFTNLEQDRGLFKVPSLRNIGFTAPYMHDGSITSLEDVLNHYSSGIKPHKNLAKQLSSIQLTDHEKAGLLAFLTTLNDSSILAIEWFHNN